MYVSLENTRPLLHCIWLRTILPSVLKIVWYNIAMLWSGECWLYTNVEFSGHFATETPTQSPHILLYLNSETIHAMLATEMQAERL